MATLTAFCDSLAAILLREKCQLLRLIRDMLEDPLQAEILFPYLPLRLYLLSLHESLSATVESKVNDHDAVSDATLSEELNSKNLSQSLSEALSSATTKKAATQSLITLGTSLPGSGIVVVLNSSLFAPMRQEVQNLIATSGTTVNSCRETAAAHSSMSSKEMPPPAVDLSQLKQLEIDDISEPPSKKSSKRKNQEDTKIYSGKKYIFKLKLKLNIYFLQVLFITRTGKGRNNFPRSIQGTF